MYLSLNNHGSRLRKIECVAEPFAYELHRSFFRLQVPCLFSYVAILGNYVQAQEWSGEEKHGKCVTSWGNMKGCYLPQWGKSLQRFDLSSCFNEEKLKKCLIIFVWWTLLSWWLKVVHCQIIRGQDKGSDNVVIGIPGFFLIGVPCVSAKFPLQSSLGNALFVYTTISAVGTTWWQNINLV